MTTTHRKPRIALMGEFSAGKSTLSNLLLGARPLPEKVTATRLSPVWMSKGTDTPYRVDIDGREEPIAIENLSTIPVEETRVIRLFFDADILDVCDLIDFPGISDPNMSSDVWQRMLREVDAVLWCTHATQAWRQSEAAVWETMPSEVRARSALLITRFDKLTTERDRTRVIARLEKETEGLFAARFPISLTDALAAGEDYDAFEASGGLDFLQYFLQMIEDLQGEVGETTETLFATHAAADVVSAKPVVNHDPVQPDPVSEGASAPAHDTDVHDTADVQMSEESDAVELPQDAETSEVVVEENVSVAPADACATEEQAADRAETSNEPQITPRRVRPQVGEGRSARPRSQSQTVDMSNVAAQLAAVRSAPAGGGVSDLRAIFQEKTAPQKD